MHNQPEHLNGTKGTDGDELPPFDQVSDDMAEGGSTHIIPPTHSILLNIMQVCVYLGGVSKSKVWAMAASGKIPRPKKIDRLTRWRRSDLDEWAAKL